MKHTTLDSIVYPRFDCYFAKKEHDNSFHTNTNESKYPLVHLNIHKGQFLLYNNLVFSDDGCVDENLLFFLASTSSSPITHISVHVYIGIVICV